MFLVFIHHKRYVVPLYLSWDIAEDVFMWRETTSTHSITRLIHLKNNENAGHGEITFLKYLIFQFWR